LCERFRNDKELGSSSDSVDELVDHLSKGSLSTLENQSPKNKDSALPISWTNFASHPSSQSSSPINSPTPSVVSSTPSLTYLLPTSSSLHIAAVTAGPSPLMAACLKNDMRKAKYLIESGECDVDAVSAEGLSPLLISCSNGNADIANLLLGAGASVEGSLGTQCLMQAAAHCLADIAQTLRGLGVHVSCDHCGTVENDHSIPMFRCCNRCRCVWYCGSNCAGLAWPTHQVSCNRAA
jgi:ankyrin repeat protein